MGKIDKIYVTENETDGTINYTYSFNNNGEAVDSDKTLQQRGESDVTLYSRKYSESGALESKTVDTDGDRKTEYEYSQKEETSLDANNENFFISEYSKMFHQYCKTPMKK